MAEKLGNKKNIIVGAATVFIGPSGRMDTETPPAVVAPAPVAEESYRDTMADTAAVSAGWRNVGYTQDGLEVATDPSFGEVEVDQLLDAAKIFKDGMGLSISTTMAEATLENLLVAWGQTDGSRTEGTEGGVVETLEIEGGNLGDAPNEYGLIAVGNGPEVEGSNKYKERTYHAFRVLSVEGSSHSLARADATVIPVTFRALPEDDGSYGYIRDRVVA